MHDVENQRYNDLGIEHEGSKSNIIYRRLDGHLRCGFTHIPLEKERRQINISDDGYTVVYILRGKGLYVDEKGNKFSIKPGTIFQRFPNVSHSVIFYPPEPMSEYFIYVPKAIAEVLLKYNFISMDRPGLDIGVHQSIITKFLDFFEKLKSAPDYKLSNIIAQAHVFITELFTVENRFSPRTDEIAMKAFSILESDFDKKLKLPELAKSLHISYSNFRKLFTEYCGVSPGEYRIRKRIEHIQQLLDSNEFTIKEVALQTGYPDIYSFSKQFKKVTGLSPRKFLMNK